MASEMREIRVVVTVPDSDALTQRGHPGTHPDDVISDLRDAVRTTVDAYHETAPSLFTCPPDVI